VARSKRPRDNHQRRTTFVKRNFEQLPTATTTTMSSPLSMAAADSPRQPVNVLGCSRRDQRSRARSCGTLSMPQRTRYHEQRAERHPCFYGRRGVPVCRPRSAMTRATAASASSINPSKRLIGIDVDNRRTAVGQERGHGDLSGARRHDYGRVCACMPCRDRH